MKKNCPQNVTGKRWGVRDGEENVENFFHQYSLRRENF
jgi:hypothetical protein